MAYKIDTVSGRDKLKPRKAPYWHKLSSGCQLGFRKMTSTSVGSWSVRVYDPATRKQLSHSLGAFDSFPPSQRFDEAKKAAEAFYEHLGRGGSKKAVTVKSACATYVDHIRGIKSDKHAKDLSGRFARWVDESKIADIPLTKLTPVHVFSWRRFLTETPVVVNPHAKEKIYRPRSPSSVNRDMTALRAALNYALEQLHVTTDMAWRTALKAIENANGRRDIYLDLKQRRALIDAAPKDVGEFLLGLSRLPLRPGALASLTVGSLDVRLNVLTVGKDKTGKNRKIKLPKVTMEFLLPYTKDRPANEPLFVRADGKAWDKDAWKKPIKAAAKTAGLPEGTTAYSLRHSTITDLVTAGVDLLTVAQLSGTSVAMIELHYGHLLDKHAEEALSILAL